ncbi:hypothetical protein OH807_23325 [Kitasatospora sp. NBC_01560]|uniref:hypothetical protein n=1 Tax=Kitasatospora sp. NBC_01560 TaxID=2975965 RepID=UPI00386B10F3
MSIIIRASGVAVTRCHYCGGGLLHAAAVRLIVVNGRMFAVHRWHPRRPGEVEA